jgi:hypothetical protein
MNPTDFATTDAEFFTLAFYLIIAGIVGAMIGAFGTVLMVAAKECDIAKEEWKKARRHYTRNENPNDLHL